MAACLGLAGGSTVSAEESAWVVLSGKEGMANWKKPHGNWYLTSDVKVDESNPRRLKGEPAEDGSIMVNGPTGITNNLISKDSFEDVELQMEFLVANKSNAGIKFHAWYEIQIFDSYGAKKIDGTHCGGVYPRAELTPKYHHIDHGIAPSSNAAKPPGEWQTLRVVFHAPRFEGDKKTKNAVLEKVELNGVTIHDNVELKWPTGNNWSKKEVRSAPLLLQGDHGPVAIRNMRVLRLPVPKESASATPRS